MSLLDKSRQIFTVTQVNRYVKKMMETDALLMGLFVEGEISNFNTHSSGHLYFTLKDSAASISSVMFRSHAENLGFEPKSGMKVIVFGRLSIYEKSGQYQLYAEYLEPAGIGGLHLAYTQLKDKLEKEGLFEPSRKREIPTYPACVAVITSPTGAAVHDIITTIRKRNTVVKIVVAPALVQGEGAADDLVRALCEVNNWGKADVIIIGRGGGSLEDLFAFNNEALARAVAASPIPVISAVGHETDFTITDFVADKRAPTPTAAADMAVYDMSRVFAYIQETFYYLTQGINRRLHYGYAEAQGLTETLNRQVKGRLEKEWQALIHQEALLEKVSPYAAFKRGYALVRDTKGAIVTDMKGLSPGAGLVLNWADGCAEVVVKSIESEPTR